jgi:hypothetical protein
LSDSLGEQMAETSEKRTKQLRLVTNKPIKLRSEVNNEITIPDDFSFYHYIYNKKFDTGLLQNIQHESFRFFLLFTQTARQPKS